MDGGTLDNEPFTADWSRAKLTVVNFWSTGCEPCAPEMAELQKLWSERRRRGLGVLGIVAEPATTERIAAFLKASGVRYPVIFPSEMTRRAWSGVTLLPATFLVGPDGRVLRRYVGAEPETIAGLRADVLAVLAGKPLPVQVMPGARSGQNAQP